MMIGVTCGRLVSVSSTKGNGSVRGWRVIDPADRCSILIYVLINNGGNPFAPPCNPVTGIYARRSRSGRSTLRWVIDPSNCRFLARSTLHDATARNREVKSCHKRVCTRVQDALTSCEACVTFFFFSSYVELKKRNVWQKIGEFHSSSCSIFDAWIESDGGNFVGFHNFLIARVFNWLQCNRCRVLEIFMNFARMQSWI